MHRHPSLEASPWLAFLDAFEGPAALVDSSARILAINEAWAAAGEYGQAAPGKPFAEAAAGIKLASDIIPVIEGATLDPPAGGLVGRATLDGRAARLRVVPLHQHRLVTLGPPDEKEELQRQIDEANDIIFTLDTSGRFVTMNRLGRELSGYSSDELLGRSAVEFVPPEHLPTVAAALATIWSGGDVDVLETEFVFKTGIRRWFEVKGRTIREDGVVKGTFHIARDITERREGEAARAKVEQELRAVARTLPAIIWTIDVNGVYQLLDGAALRDVGLEPNELVGSSVFRVLEASPELLEPVYRGLRGEEFTQTISWRGGTYESHFVPLRDADGAQSGLMSIAFDITERLRTEELRARAEKLESLTILAGGVAHDFNNLLVGILGNASLALMELDPGSPIRETIEEIEAAGARAAQLARQMLDFSGRSQFVRQPLQLNDLVREALADTAGAQAARLDLDPALPLISGDPAQVRVAINALLINAVEAGGGIEVRTALRDCTWATFEECYLSPALPDGRYAALTVADSGTGIAEDVLDRIFEPFFTTRFTGRGLGLAALHGIVRSHRGAVRVESSPGAGAEFTVYLPLASDA